MKHLAAVETFCIVLAVATGILLFESHLPWGFILLGALPIVTYGVGTAIGFLGGVVYERGY